MNADLKKKVAEEFAKGIKEVMNRHTCEINGLHAFSVSDGKCLLCKKTKEEITQTK